MASFVQRHLDDPAADAALLLTRIGLAVLAFAVPSSAVLSRRALFTLLFVGGGLLIVASTLLPRPPVRRRLGYVFGTASGVGGLVLLGWGAASLLWTPFPMDAAARWAKDAGTIAFVVLTVVLLPERTRTSNLYLFPLGVAAAAAATVGVAAFDPGVLGGFQNGESTLGRAVVGLVMLVWPALGALAVRDRWVSAVLLVVGVSAAALAAWTTPALVALAFGALAFALATFDALRAGRVLAALAAAAVLLAPALPLSFGALAANLAAAYGDRIAVLNGIAGALGAWAALVLGEPLRLITGHGLDMTARASLAGFLPPDAPRSALFEIWYDFGLVGAVAAAILAAGALAAAGRSSATVAPFLLAELVTGLSLAAWGVYTTQLWWITLLGVAAIAFANVIHGQYRTDRPAARLTAESAMRREPAL